VAIELIDVLFALQDVWGNTIQDFNVNNDTVQFDKSTQCSFASSHVAKPSCPGN